VNNDDPLATIALKVRDRSVNLFPGIADRSLADFDITAEDISNLPGKLGLMRLEFGSRLII